MDPISSKTALAAAGASGDKVYVDDVFSTYLWTGDATATTITNDIDVSGEGGLVWIKNRTDAASHYLFDTERGASKVIYSQSPAGESNTSIFSSFNSDGFSVASSLSENNKEYASWTFRKAPGFFDVVTYTGNGTAGRTVAHNLGSVPGCILIKETDGTEDWRVYHRSLGATKNLRLNQNFAAGTSTAIFNNTEPTSTVFTVGTDPATNGNGKNFVAYLFAHDDQSFGENGDESIIKCGSFTTDSSGAATVDLGFEPEWILTKPSSASGNWGINDSMRGMPGGKSTAASPYAQGLFANLTNAEGNWDAVSPFATGFKVLGSGVLGTNTTSIYIAIRRPHKPPEAGTDVFAVDLDSASSTIPTWDSGFPVDMSFYFDTLGGGGLPRNSARLLGSKYLVTSATSAEASDGSLVWDSNVGWGKDYDVNRVYYSHMFRRAPGFFDVVAYTGTGSATTVSHNLTVAPELMIVKSRSGAYGWRTYDAFNGPTKGLLLNDTAASLTSSAYWNDTSPTNSVFTVGTNFTVNRSSYTYIAYLFATLPGISKVGSYTGTGSNIGVNCGFTAGARFVLIKRTDSTGDWYVYDSTRGIVGGNDPYILLNSTAAETTTTDYIDPLNSGFTVTSSAPAALNASGGTYLFLAIA